MIARPTLPGAALVLALGALAAGCGGGSSGGGAPPPTSGAPHGLPQREVPSGLAFPTGAGGGGGQATFARAFPGLSFDRPVLLTHAPDGSDRVFIVEQDGRIRVFPNDDAAAAAGVFLDITAQVFRGGSEEGLLGLAFDPDYATSGTFYVHYSVGGASRLSRFTVSAGDPDRADAGSEEVLLTVAQPFSNHNGGMIEFGPDGFLYVALGDGGSGGDPQNNGQDTSTLLGALLRIDPRGGSPYAIPGDNPFAGGGGRAEIYAFGLRNPWRFSFDRATGELYVGDVGQGTREEVSVVARGDNLGWRAFEGDEPFQNPGGLPASSFTAPLIDYDRATGTTVIGGYVYRGAAHPSLVGTYFYGDYGADAVWALTRDASGAVATNQQVASVPNLSSFGEDEAGELFAVSLDGGLWRLEATPGGAGGGGGAFPQRLSDTGLFTDVASLTPAPGVIEYEVNAPFWSDGARKRRFIALPGAETIGFDATDPWSFPVGTVLVKHFELEVAPGVYERLETRVLLHEAGGWAGYAYRWNAAGTDADLLSGAEDVTLTVTDASGTRQQTYHVPSRSECLRCHTAAAGRVLGVRTGQLRRDFDYPAATDDQLRAWNHVGLFDRDIGAETQYDAWPDPADAGASLDDRARSYLAANCSQCHRPQGPAPGGIDLRFDTPLASTDLVGVAPTEGDLGLPSPLRVDPGDRTSSVLWRRVTATDATRMPPIASNEVDPLAEQLLGDWIDGL